MQLRGGPRPVDRQQHVAVRREAGPGSAIRGDEVPELPVVGSQLASQGSQVGWFIAALVAGWGCGVDDGAGDHQAAVGGQEFDDPGLGGQSICEAVVTCQNPAPSGPVTAVTEWTWVCPLSQATTHG